MSSDLERRQLLTKGLTAVAALALLGESQESKDQKTQSKDQATSSPSPIPLDIQKALQSVGRPKLENVVPPFPETSLSKSEEPFSRNEDEWKKIITEMMSVYSIKDFEDLKNQISRNLLEIDTHFSFQSLECDDGFRFHHVEHLLDQAADLLARGLQLRDEWDDLAAKSFNVAMELKEYYELDKIHQDEVKAGFYTLPYKESMAELAAQNSTLFGHLNELGFLEWLLRDRYSRAEMNAQSGYAQCLAWLSQIDRTKMNVTWNGVTNNVAEHAKLAAFGESFQYLYTQMGTISAQRSVAEASRQAADARWHGVATRNSWDLSDVTFKRRRTDVARRIADYKAKAFTDVAGALNYPQKMRYIRDLFNRDFRDALARVYAAESGLRELYGYKVPLPATLQALQTKNASPSIDARYFSECLAWVRDAMSWLVCFSQLDQNYVLPVSVRQFMKEDEWEAGRKIGEWRFEVPESLFPEQRHVRLRGISAVVVMKRVDEDDRQGVWLASISAPKESFCRHLSGDMVNLNQSQLPICRIGRISTREGTQEADITGAIALHNASPFGKWSIKLNSYSTTRVERHELRDLNLDLHLSVRST